jgi:hypothetical protein
MKKKRIPQENTSRAYRIQFLYRPGRRLGDDAMQSLVRELREVAGTCFETIPPYQALQGSREELSDKVITVARQCRPDAVFHRNTPW